ncbi:LLM class flavin-dependent oxidoreductase [Methylobacterium sp. WL30]|uniref:LLM class flavin-dependent oxidoreductase n=1 Tax=unclassified Methylobacterium TaxID=2615210 RepID=UPI0011CC7918|nr:MULTISPECIES: LLM class flavin-dependent oxidoreductase [unclassified Methylobacterium]TXM93708.1 LLM class flavin-dependent oxidoreductase [Methylobacterium sp. WL116]TXN38634.1 LLM class flavin-dependent oxidoreductase [Methylobacterium sp. WL93]TXN50159.1 LLM class flavin-dependent oxidoreductase [Methylobacterium sp. WL119]TXN67909.1 LLM class flavin-dependent oxidoreductase [Methylobacterium sp. WL30]
MSHLPPDAVEFIGFAAPRLTSEIHPAEGPAIDRDYLDRLAQAHEAGGFDRILVAAYSTAPDALLIASRIAAVTRRIGLMIAHRTGFTAPTVAARQFATLDQLTGGRIAIHAISGGDDRDLARDGDHLSKDERYARTREFLDVARLSWTAETPFDYAGSFYQVEQGFSEVKPVRADGIPVFFGGASPAALDVAGRHADTYALWGETLDQVRDLIARVRAAAAPYGRNPRFSLSFRPILADTEAAAWTRAEAILARTKALRAARGLGPAATPQNEGARRLLAAAASGTRLDKRLYTAIAAETGAAGNSTALVGTPDQVAEALLDYHDLGVRTFLIRGFDPLEDAIGYGRDLLPAFRAQLANRSATADAA